MYFTLSIPSVTLCMYVQVHDKNVKEFPNQRQYSFINTLIFWYLLTNQENQLPLLSPPRTNQQTLTPFKIK